jgi:hypothetical protein
MHVPAAIGLREDRGLLGDQIRDARWLRPPYCVTGIALTADPSPCVPSVDPELVTSGRTTLREIAPFLTTMSDQAEV